MADFKQIEINGTSYTVKDETARTAAASATETANAAKAAAETATETANTANTNASAALQKATTNETNIGNLAAESLVANYLSATETIQFTKGISYTD